MVQTGVSGVNEDGKGLERRIEEEKCGQSLDETAIPEDIACVEDLVPYVRDAIAALQDRSNYQQNCDGMIGCPDLSGIAAKALGKKGFGKHSAFCITHAFHWFMYQEKGLVIYKASNSNGGKKDGTSSAIFVPNEEKFSGASVDGLTEDFMKKHGEYIFARIQRIRGHPEHRPY